MLLAVVIGLVVVALAFDFINGFHDAANSIATIVSTRVLSPITAVAWAAFFNFVAAAPVFFGGELRVAQTVGKGIIQFDLLKAQGVEIVLAVIFAALVGAIVWNLLTWWWGLPSSSSHTGGERTGGLGDPQDRRLHRPLPAHRHGARLGSHDRDGLDRAGIPPRPRRHLVPQAAARVLGRLQLQPRVERRPEGDGHHRRDPLRDHLDRPS